MAKIDLSKFTFVGDVLKGVGELVFEKMLDTRNALQFVTTFDNIKVDTEIGFIGEGGLVGLKSNGCDPTPQDFNASTRKVKWTPEDWELLLHLCYTDLDGTIAEYSRKNGVKKPDLTNTDYEAILETVLSRALNKFLWRLVWFNDKNAANKTDGGVIADGVDVGYFNIINGLWKQIFAQVTATGNKQYIDLSGYDVTDAADVKKLLYAMTTKASLVLRQQTDRFILVTQDIFDKYVEALSDTAIAALETVQSRFIEGATAVKVNGVEVVAMPEWDEHIAAYEPTNKPSRALYTCKSVLGVGFDKEGDFNNLDIWYDKDTRKVKIEAMGNADTKLLDPTLFVAAY